MNFIQDIISGVLPFLDSVPAVRAILGFILVFFLPGFAWTLVMFRGRRINWIERLALSVGISIAVVTLVILALNWLFDVRINGINAVITILVITAVPLAWYFLARVPAKPKNVDK